MADCPRRTFAEPFVRPTPPYARLTSRLSHALEHVALAGRAGSRLTSPLDFHIGRMALLRKVMALPDPRPATPRVLGVDDFPTRCGQTYSTVLTCGGTHRVVDVLPTRESGPFAGWLAAPNAIQVADRFHLWQGIGRAVETCVAAHRECLNAPTPPSKADVEASGETTAPVGPDLDGRRAQRKKARHALVHELLGRGLNTVLRYAHTARWQDTLRENRPRPTTLDPYKPYLERRFAAGCTSVTRLHRELLTANAPVTYQMVRAYIVTLRAALKNVLARCPELDAAEHVRGFGEILTNRLGTTLPAGRPHPRLELRQHRRRC
ncbi:hypothetical protein AB0E08_49480 [Streptomyces sp. NPDC048281]|uniref:hypothetical protein n=1 Tax=Streptomyces sp. NPDC048281 TaxID=3154715 RepID=UPI00341D67D3